MDRKTQYYKIILTVRSPVHIGSGRTLKKKEYYYDHRMKKAKIIDLEKFAVLINSKGLFDSYLEYMSYQGGYDLREYFRRNKITNSELESVIAYEIDSSDLVVEGKQFDIDTFVKDAYGKPYIPGTTLKGCLRTALLANYIMSSSVSYEENRHAVQIADFTKRRKDLLRYEERDIQIEAFHTLERPAESPHGRPTDRKNAVNDVMQGIIISDSEPLDTDCLALCQKNDRKLNGEITHLPTYMECLKPGTRVCFDMKIDTAVTDITAEFITDSIKRFVQTYSDCYMNAFYQVPQTLPDNTVYIGGNTGFPTKTVIYNMFGREEGKEITVKILSALGFREKNAGDISLDVSPHILKTTMFNQQQYRMGEAEIVIK